MSTKTRATRPARGRQKGSAIIEMALAGTAFLLFLFGWMEVARYMYLLNIGQAVTRRVARAAAMTDFSDAAAMAQLRQQALFNATTQGGAISAANIAIDYLRLDAAGELQVADPMPASPAVNAFNCLHDLQGASCIRFVRVRLCGIGDGCPPPPFVSLVQLPMPLTLPYSTVVVRAENLGFQPGAPLSP